MDDWNAVASVGVNVAFNEWVPMTKVVDMDAVPDDTATGEPIAVVPSQNCTEPTADEGVSVAVRVEAGPTTIGLGGVTPRVVVVATAGVVIVYGNDDDVDIVNFVASVGVNIALSECDPAVSDVVEKLAMPLATVTGLPMLVVPSLNWTVPTAVDGLTVAFSATEAPRVCVEAGVADNAVVVVVGGAGGVGYT